MTPEEIRALRKSWGINQTELARIMGQRQETISRWERGLNAPEPASLRLLIAYRDGYRPKDWPSRN